MYNLLNTHKGGIKLEHTIVTRKMIEELYYLRGGQYFDVTIQHPGRKNHFDVRISGVITIVTAGVAYVTTVIGFEDNTFIFSVPQDSSQSIMGKFLEKINKLYNAKPTDLKNVTNRKIYESYVKS